MFSKISTPVYKLGQRKIIKNNVYESFEDAVGNTPLLKLKRASELTGCNIYGKCEFMNPGGSVKDRAALYLIKNAEDKGLLTPGKPGVIVEGTAGNTGIGLALIAGCRGYQTVIVIPETQTQEKKDMLRIAGAQLVEVPALPYKNPNTYIKISQRIAKELGAVWANQFDNPDGNKQAHIETTGPEIWEQLEGKVDGFTCAIGTGGTLAGTSEYLRSQNKNVKIALSDPQGAALVRYYQDGLLRSEGSSITEGIGQGRVTKNIENFKPDYTYEIPDSEGLEVNYDLLQNEGLCLGGSSGINVAGAIRLAKELGPGHNIVTILCDWGNKYQGKMFNPPFLKNLGLPTPKWMENIELNQELKDAVKRATLPDDIVQEEIKKFEEAKKIEKEQWEQKQKNK